MTGSLELQSALSCERFDTIRLAAANYTFENDNMQDCDSALCIDRPVTLEAAVPGAVTLDGGGALRVMSITGGTVESPVELVGLTITGGSASEASACLLNHIWAALLAPRWNVTPYPFAFQEGGGAHVTGHASFTDCVFSANGEALLAF